MLQLELRRGCDDRAIAGGLDRLLARLAQTDGTSITLPAYAPLADAARRRWVEAALRWLEEGGGGREGAQAPIAGQVQPAGASERPIGAQPSGGPVAGARAASGPDRTREGNAPRDRAAARPSASLPSRAAGNVATPDQTGGRGNRPGGATAARRPAPLQKPAEVTLDSPVALIPRTRRDVAGRLAKLGVRTIRDMLYFFPRRHLDFSHTVSVAELVPGEEATAVGVVWEAHEVSIGPRIRGTEAIIGDVTGTLRAVWFNQPYLVKQLPPQARIALSGRVSVYRGQKQMESPEYEVLAEGEEQTHTGRLVPVYALTDGLPQRTVRNLARRALDNWAARVPDSLPADVLARYRLPALPEALRNAHFPATLRDFVRARHRLAFDELLALQVWMLSRRREWQSVPAAPITPDPAVLQGFLKQLPFTLTEAQLRAHGDIQRDIERSEPMSRLLQGDVGSGKTVVAAAALLQAVAAGHQGAFMAPTEILAEQHYRSLVRLLSGAEPDELEARVRPEWLNRSLCIALLVGRLTPRQKRQVQRSAAAGLIDILVGTHALIQEAAGFERLALAVIDEQHRFGTAQRRALRQKGGNPHLLVMTATPVPRSLALTLYGDLELSVMDQLPQGRRPIQTRIYLPHQRHEAYELVRREIAAGRQAFVICPLIEESEVIEARAATAEHARLAAEVFPDLRLGLLHGQMSGTEKDEIMNRFRARELDILVATTVIEVGIDVPNATVMLIEGSDRFGVSQLHQLRGRVGRGGHQSYCLLAIDALESLSAVVAGAGAGAASTDEEIPVSNAAEFSLHDVLAIGEEMLHVTRVTRDAKLITAERGVRGSVPTSHPPGTPILRIPRRLTIVERYSDGFRLAEEDVRLRGLGALSGTRQSGVSEFRMAQLPRDHSLLLSARREARRILDMDPALDGPYRELRAAIDRLGASEHADVS